MNTASVLYAAASTSATLLLVLLAVLAVKVLAAWFRALERRDMARAEEEGARAALYGEPGTSNPYIGESSDRFQAMAKAWAKGWVKTTAQP